MCGIAMPQGMNRNMAFIDTGGSPCPSKCSLNAINSHWIFCVRAIVVASASGRKYKIRIFMCNPIPTQQVKGIMWKRDIAVFGSFAPVDMDHHTLAVNIGNLQAQCFRKSQTTGIYRGQKGIVVEGSNVIQYSEDFFLA